jgi:hypothetical protein
MREGIQELTKFKEDPCLRNFAVNIDAAISWHEQFPTRFIPEKPYISKTVIMLRA